MVMGFQVLKSTFSKDLSTFETHISEGHFRFLYPLFGGILDSENHFCRESISNFETHIKEDMADFETHF